MVEVIVAAFGLIGIIITAWKGKKNSDREALRANQAEKEVRFQKAALSFSTFIEEWSGTHKEIETLLNNTSIDRFMILRAWNGALNPRWTTAVFQMRQGDQEPMSYVHFELDTDYVKRLKEVSLSNVVVIDTKELDKSSAIRHVYEAEGVNHAVWCHISSENIIGEESVAHTYCSFATHVNEPLDSTTITKCVILAGRLKGVAMSFESSN